MIMAMMQRLTNIDMLCSETKVLVNVKESGVYV